MATYAAYAPAAPAQYAQPVAAAAPDPYQQAYGAPQAYAPAPQYAYAAPYMHNPDEVRTVFITGFPADVKERELNNLMRFLPGYEVGHCGDRSLLLQSGKASPPQNRICSCRRHRCTGRTARYDS